MSEYRTAWPALLALALGGAGAVVTPASAPVDRADRVTICHHAGPTKQFEIAVAATAVPGHLRHGDSVGACDGGGPA